MTEDARAADETGVVPHVDPEPLAPHEEPTGGAERILALSGGGYRATCFHAGVLLRLNEARLLGAVGMITSVSGGSLVAGRLAARWHALRWDGEAGAPRRAANLEQEVIAPLLAMAGRLVDVPAVIAGLLVPGRSVNDFVARACRRHLVGDCTLQDLPHAPADPVFVLCATHLQTGVLWRFTRERMGAYLVGYVPRPTTSLATAMAASSAFPPFLSPAILDFDAGTMRRRKPPAKRDDLDDPEFQRRAVLVDGGVYDNLGLEPAWQRRGARMFLVSDAGLQMRAHARPHTVWPLQAVRTANVLDNQVRALRKRRLLEAYRRQEIVGAYFSIRSDIEDFGVGDPLGCPYAKTSRLAAIRTSLSPLPTRQREQLANWGFAVCDAALRRHVDAGLPVPPALPFPAAGVG